MKGRKRTPDGIAALRGNPGKRKLNQAGNPASWPKFTCPRSLGRPARKHFRALLKELTRCGVAPSASPDLIMLYATVRVRWEDAEKRIAASGPVLAIAGKKGKTQPNPFISVANKAHEQMLRILIECGLTPTARTRITSGIEPPKDELEDFIDDKKKASG